MKIVSLSFDDGTIYDVRFTELLNKYNLRATLNLNSGFCLVLRRKTNKEIGSLQNERYI